MTTCTRHPHITKLKKLLLLLFGYFGYVHFIFNPSHKLPTEDSRGRFSTAAAARAVLRAVLTVSGSDRIDWQKHLKLFQKLFHIVSAITQPQGTWSLSFQQDFMPSSSKEGSPGGPSTGHIFLSLAAPLPRLVGGAHSDSPDPATSLSFNIITSSRIQISQIWDPTNVMKNNMVS